MKEWQIRIPFTKDLVVLNRCLLTSYTCNQKNECQLCQFIQAAKLGCEALVTRMTPVVDNLSPDATWKEKVKACFQQGVDLTARGM